MAKPKTIVATGVANRGGLSGRDIEAAMAAAVEQCSKNGITDADEVREAMLAAREKVKADFARASSAKKS